MKKPVNQKYDEIFATNIATIGLRFDGADLVCLDYLTKKETRKSNSKQAKQVRSKIEAYLDKKSRLKTSDIDVRIIVTPFQERVLKQLQRIPYGETRTYGEIAKILNTSPRAVGNACRNNPLPIVIPCHRVVAANGLGGYDGATDGEILDIKYQLLKLEGVF